jgi:hypothetical protein
LAIDTATAFADTKQINKIKIKSFLLVTQSVLVWCQAEELRSSDD